MKTFKAADLHGDLVATYQALKDGTMDRREAMERNNTAGKIIALAKVQLTYAAMRGEKPGLPFLDTDDTKQIE